MRSLKVLVSVALVLALALVVFGQGNKAPQAPATTAQRPGFDINSLDKNIDACQNFY